MWSTRSDTLTRTRGYPFDVTFRRQSEPGKKDQKRSMSCHPYFPFDLSQPSCSIYSAPIETLAPPENGLPSTYVPHFHDEKLLRKMSYSRLGQTDMFISKISLGCGPIGGNYGKLGSPAAKIVEAALKSGINLIDTGYWYGQRRSEEMLGKVLAQFPRKSYLLSVRVGHFDLDYARAFDYRADSILHALTRCLRRLGLPYVDICYLQIHDSEFDLHKHLLMYESLPALGVAQRSGRIRYIGLTGYSLKKLAFVVEKSPVETNVVMTYCRGTLSDNSFGEYSRFFESKNIGVINASPLSMGLLTTEGPPQWHPASAEIKGTCADAVRYCVAKKSSMEKLALHYAFNFPGFCSCCVGMDSVQQVLQNVQICQMNNLSDTEQRIQNRLLRRHFDQLQNANWEGMDVHAYWKRMKALGIAILPTSRTASVESISSRLTTFSLR